ncbi:hypothetical protein [Paenibacillus sp. P22]|nr:hypothetical protein [Paenibacillus sp. P22]CDN41460.1 hypothetical protein BN871_AH_00340 [Paenibacillus sp. P22]
MRPLKEFCARLAQAGYGPIPYWLSMPLEELYDWINLIYDMQPEGGGQ